MTEPSTRRVFITEQELRQIERANAIHRQPVIFISNLQQAPGLDRWSNIFEAAGYASLTPGWPKDARPMPEARSDIEGVVVRITDHFANIAARLDRRPAIVGRSLGGLVAQALAGRGLSAATVTVNATPFDDARANLRRETRAALLPCLLVLQSGSASLDHGSREVAEMALEFVRKRTRRQADVDAQRFGIGFMAHGAGEDRGGIPFPRRGSVAPPQPQEFAQVA